jgi:hypothetical protein
MDDMLREIDQMMEGQEKYEKIAFYDEEQDGFAEFFVLERTKLNGVEYLLATQDLNQDADGYVFRVTAEHVEEDSEVSMELELVEDETELEAVGKIFAELLSDDLNIEV